MKMRIKLGFKLAMRACAFSLLLPLSAFSQTYELDLAGSPGSYRSNLQTVILNGSANPPIRTEVLVRNANAAHTPVVLTVVKTLGRGVNSTGLQVQIGTRLLVLKVPNSIANFADPNAVTKQLDYFETSQNQLRSLKEWYDARPSIENRVANVVSVQPRRFSLTEFVDITVSDFLANYNPADAQQASMMRDLISAAKDMSGLKKVVDLHGGNAGFAKGKFKIFDAGDPFRPNELITEASATNDLTVLEQLSGVGDKPNLSQLEIANQLKSTFKVTAAAADEIAAGIIEVRGLRTTLPPAELPSGSASCSTRPSGSLPGVGAALGFLDMVGIFESAYEETYTATGSAPNGSWNGKPGVKCSALLPRVHSLYCERDWGITDIFYGGDYRCSYISEVTPNGRAKYSSTPDEPTCTVVYRNYVIRLKTDQDYEFGKIFAKGKQPSNIASFDLVESFLESHFSYRFTHVSDVSGTLVYPPGGDIY